jgi:hypothetical protein
LPRRLRGLSLLTLLVAGLAGSTQVLAADLLDLDYRPLASKQQVNLQQRYHGQVLLVVNTASKCGYTLSTKAWRRCRSAMPAAVLPCSASRPTISRARSPVTRSRSRISARSPTGQVPDVREGARGRCGGRRSING